MASRLAERSFRRVGKVEYQARIQVLVKILVGLGLGLASDPGSGKDPGTLSTNPDPNALYTHGASASQAFTLTQGGA